MNKLYNSGKVSNEAIIGIIILSIVLIFWFMSKKLETFVAGEMEDQLGGNASVAAFNASEDVRKDSSEQ